MNEEICAKIVKYIKRNRVSTTEVADCLDKTGSIKGVLAVNSGLHKVGKIRYIYGFSESNWNIHEQARDAGEGEVIIIDGIDVHERALVGELVVKFLVLYRGVEAIVILGKVRDANDLIKNKYPVWCNGYTPEGCFNTQEILTAEINKIAEEQHAFYNDSIAVCDDTGVVIISKDKITEDFFVKLENIEEQEDIWFNCIDRLHWDTYDTVCLKKYRDL